MSISGECLCGAVQYEVDEPLQYFQYCHCSRCRKVSGSAFAANLFVPPAQFRWLKGEANVGRFEVGEAKYYACGFCKTCGSSLPWAVQGGKNMVVPAGGLASAPAIKPQQNVFWASRAPWHVSDDCLSKYDGLPSKS